MIVMHIAYSLELIALAAGTSLMVWSMKNPGKGSFLGKLIGALVMVLSIISLVCMFSCAMRGGECHGMGHGEGMMGMMAPPPPPGGSEHGHEHEHGHKMMEQNKS